MTSHDLEFFDSISSRWDSMETHSIPATVNSLLDSVDVKRGMRILDLGTGTGVLIPFLIERIGTAGGLKAIDMSTGMLNEARRKYGSLYPNLDIERKDFEEETVQGQFDLIFLYCVYPHLSRPNETLRRLAHTNLVPGGRIIIGFPTDESYINNIHKERKVESDLLPPAELLAQRLSDSGLKARVIPSVGYLVEVMAAEE